LCAGNCNDYPKMTEGASIWGRFVVLYYMKNTSYLSALLDYLRTSMTIEDDKYGFKVGKVWDWSVPAGQELDRPIGDFTVDELRMICNADFAEGANCQAFVLPDGVIKWYTGMGIQLHENADSDRDLRVYRKAVEMGYETHLARTEVIGNFTVQERIIPMSEVIHTMTRDHRMSLFDDVNELGRVLGIGDLHENNWGFRPDDDAFVTPVIFDYSCDRRYENDTARFSGNRYEDTESERCSCCTHTDSW